MATNKTSKCYLPETINNRLTTLYEEQKYYKSARENNTVSSHHAFRERQEDIYNDHMNRNEREIMAIYKMCQ